LQSKTVFGILLRKESDHHMDVYRVAPNRFKNVIARSMCLCLLFILLNSCKDEVADTHTSSRVLPDSLLSFSKDIEPLFQETCLGGQCHSSRMPAKNLNLESDVWHSLIDHTPVIVINKNGNASLLVQYLDGRFQPQMPLRSTPLTANQIRGVKKWIDEGALPN
jgi:hypothetical protein